MDEQTARWLLYGITAVAVIAWAAGARFLGRSFRGRAGGDREPGDHLRTFEQSSATTIRDSVEVEGSPEDLAAKATSLLADRGAGPAGPIKIVESGGDRLVVEGMRGTADPQSPSRFLRKAEFRFRPSGGRRTRIDYEIELSSGRGLMLGGMIFQMLGLAAIVAGFVLVSTYVVPNPDPAVRGQTFQMLQVAHFLWPPFLFGTLYRRGRNALREAFEVLLHNLPYYGTR